MNPWLWLLGGIAAIYFFKGQSGQPGPSAPPGTRPAVPPGPSRPRPATPAPPFTSTIPTAADRARFSSPSPPSDLPDPGYYANGDTIQSKDGRFWTVVGGHGYSMGKYGTPTGQWMPAPPGTRSSSVSAAITLSMRPGDF